MFNNLALHPPVLKLHPHVWWVACDALPTGKEARASTLALGATSEAVTMKPRCSGVRGSDSAHLGIKPLQKRAANYIIITMTGLPWVKRVIK